MKPHSLHRLASRVYNIPHLLTTPAFNVILDYFDARNSTGVINFMPATSGVPEYMPDDDNETDDNTANDVCVICVDGSLTYKPLMTMCGEIGTSYESLSNQVENAIEEGCSTIILEMSSPGGEAQHVFETAQDIRDMCDAAGVKLVAYADTMACSAAYALSVVCDEIVMNPSAVVGSIGCVVCLMDTSKAMDMAGYKRIFITSGDQKVPFTEDGSFKPDFLAEIQRDVDALNMQFTNFVSQYTDIPTDTIIGFQAGTFNAQEALDNGLANKIMTKKQFAAYVADTYTKGAM